MPGNFKKTIIVSLLHGLIAGLFLFGVKPVWAADPIGFFDTADCSQMTGWSVDQNYLNSPNQVLYLKTDRRGLEHFLDMFLPINPEHETWGRETWGRFLIKHDIDKKTKLSSSKVWPRIYDFF